jgi:hypothetical protein
MSSKKTTKSSVKTAKKHYKTFKKLPTWAKVVSVVLVLIIISGILYFAFENPEIIENIFSNSNQNGNTDTNGDSNSTTNIGSSIVQAMSGLGGGDLRVHFINIGQGDAIYIQFPNGTDMLIDGGCEYNTTGPVSSVLDYLKEVDTNTNLTYLMVTHPDYDHYSQLISVLNYYDVDNIYLPYCTVDWGDVVDEDTAMFDGGHLVTTQAYKNFAKTAVVEEAAVIAVNVGVFSLDGLGENVNFSF